MLHSEAVRTPSSQCFVDVTQTIRDLIKKNGMTDGQIFVSVPHTTAALTVNENADPHVVTDMIRRLNQVFPEHDPADKHAEGNSHAHVKSSLLGTCHPFMVSNGDLVLGTWQGIYLCEFDGPRTRRLLVQTP